MRHSVITNHTAITNSNRYLPPTTLKTAQSDESRMIEACEAVRGEEKPNITKIARGFGVNRRSLHNRVKNGTQARSARQLVNKVLDSAHEEVLTRGSSNALDMLTKRLEYSSKA